MKRIPIYATYASDEWQRALVRPQAARRHDLLPQGLADGPDLLNRLSALGVFHSEWIFYGGFLWVRGVLNSPKRRFPARAERRERQGDLLRGAGGEDQLRGLPLSRHLLVRLSTLRVLEFRPNLFIIIFSILLPRRSSVITCNSTGKNTILHYLRNIYI